ncbi:hypothetical protein HPB47_027453 [Ixodes persulcatus]|uniref:Uncharacterized protein n=1 Tax=Ixodes persulcatus TaxID=34615 RepID=A0AC60PXW4_IXOPE|nr:hypothetical protein HPB47_027453 [Ixodes persulcatus]
MCGRLVFFVMDSYMVQKKIKVTVFHWRNKKNDLLTDRQFKLERKRNHEWIKKNCDISLQQKFGKSQLRQKLSYGVPDFSKEVDVALFEFLKRKRSEGRAVSNRLSSEGAFRIAIQLQLGNFVPSSHYRK